MSDNKLKVISYMENRNQETLCFRNVNEEDHRELIGITKEEPKTLEDAINRILLLTEFYPSYCEDKLETEAGKWRSSLDIWRHVKFYFPDVTIFSVMETLYNMRNNLVGHYCKQICRRVFKTRKLVKNYQYHLFDVLLDEYNLSFSQWRDINA